MLLFSSIGKAKKKPQKPKKPNQPTNQQTPIFPYFLGNYYLYIPCYWSIPLFKCVSLDACVCMWLHREAERGTNFWVVHFNGKKTKVIQSNYCQHLLMSLFRVIVLHLDIIVTFWWENQCDLIFSEFLDLKALRFLWVSNASNIY